MLGHFLIPGPRVFKMEVGRFLPPMYSFAAPTREMPSLLGPDDLPAPSADRRVDLYLRHISRPLPGDQYEIFKVYSQWNGEALIYFWEQALRHQRTLPYGPPKDWP